MFLRHKGSLQPVLEQQICSHSIFHFSRVGWPSRARASTRVAAVLRSTASKLLAPHLWLPSPVPSCVSSPAPLSAAAGRAGPLFPPSDGPSAHRFLASHRAEHRRCLSSWGPWLQMTVTWGALNNRYLFSHCSGRCTSKPGCQQSRAPSEDSRGEPLLAPYHSGGTGLSWACGPITEVSASSSQGHPDPQAPSAFLSSGHLSVDLSPTG